MYGSVTVSKKCLSWQYFCASKQPIMQFIAIVDDQQTYARVTHFLDDDKLK